MGTDNYDQSLFESSTGSDINIDVRYVRMGFIAIKRNALNHSQLQLARTVKIILKGLNKDKS